MSSTVPITLPELGAEQADIHVSLWFAKSGEWVDAGEQIVEVQVPGMTFDVCAPASGRLATIETPVATRVRPGDILGWLST